MQDDTKSNAVEKRPRQLSLKQRIAFSLLTVVLVIVLVEVLGQVALFVKRRAFPIECNDPNENGCPIQPFQQDQLAALVSDPLTAFSWQPGYQGEWLSINSLGFRGEEISLDRIPGVPRVAMVGGSAALGVGVHDDETIEVYLQVELARRLGQPVEVVNGGVTGFNSSQELAQILYRLTELNPDVIVVYDGRNDVYFGLSPRWQPHYTPSMQDMRQLTNIQPPREFARTPAGNFLQNRTAIGIVIGQLNYTVEQNTAVESLQMNEQALSVYQTNLERMGVIASIEDFQLVLVMQPSMAAGNKTLTPSEESYVELARNEGYFDLLAEYYPAGVEALLQAGANTGTPAYDFTPIFDDVAETIYLDEVHLTPTGNQMVASQLADIIAPLFKSGEIILPGG